MERNFYFRQTSVFLLRIEVPHYDISFRENNLSISSFDSLFVSTFFAIILSTLKS